MRYNKTIHHLLLALPWTRSAGFQFEVQVDPFLTWCSVSATQCVAERWQDHPSVGLLQQTHELNWSVFQRPKNNV